MCRESLVVYNHVKDTKFHQFTTNLELRNSAQELSIITSKIQNFINSQHGEIIHFITIVVYNHVKDTKFHQFTTCSTPRQLTSRLSIITSKIQNFINSQPSCVSREEAPVVYNHVKDTKFHQFTTSIRNSWGQLVLSIITSKIQNFINSQPFRYGGA